MAAKARELVIVSGKGGTGKTSILASFAALGRADRIVLADCDVDAADLHLVLRPRVVRRETFRGGHVASIRAADCRLCGYCFELCRFGAVREVPSGRGALVFSIDPAACEGCGVCRDRCPAGAIDFLERTSGEWYVSETDYGPLVHARLLPGAENSGKLVKAVRDAAREIAEGRGADAILVDGPPGAGCPVIASVAGAALVLAVAEPTLSALHDLRRVLGLARHFHIPCAVAVNKCDIAPELTERIESEAAGAGASLAGRVRYDSAVTAAQIQGKPVAEMPGSPAAQDIRELWDRVREDLLSAAPPREGR